MSYTLQAFIGEADVVGEGVITGATVRPLYGSLVILPLVEAVAKPAGIPFLPLTDEGLGAVPGINTVGCALSKRGKVVYVEAEFFGGVGTQAHCLFENGIVKGRPAVHEKAINEALRFLDVKVTGGIDEFATVGLDRKRSTEEWL